MKKFLHILFISVFCLSFFVSSAISDDIEIPLTEKQKIFAKHTIKKSSLAKAEWSNSYVLDATLAESKNEKFLLTQEQKNFAYKINNDNTGFYKAEWVNTYELELNMKQIYSGILTKSAAKRQALLLASQGYLYTEKNICVKITDPKHGELAYECMGDQSES